MMLPVTEFDNKRAQAQDAVNSGMAVGKSIRAMLEDWNALVDVMQRLDYVPEPCMMIMDAFILKHRPLIVWLNAAKDAC